MATPKACTRCAADSAGPFSIGPCTITTACGFACRTELSTRRRRSSRSRTCSLARRLSGTKFARSCAARRGPLVGPPPLSPSPVCASNRSVATTHSATLSGALACAWKERRARAWTDRSCKRQVGGPSHPLLCLSATVVLSRSHRVGGGPAGSLPTPRRCTPLTCPASPVDREALLAHAGYCVRRSREGDCARSSWIAQERPCT